MKIKALKSFDFGDGDNQQSYKAGHLYEVNAEESDQIQKTIDEWSTKGLVEVMTDEQVDKLVVHDDDKPEVALQVKEMIEDTATQIVAQTKAAPNRPAVHDIEVGEPAILEDENWGFKSLSEFHLATYREAHPGIRKVDPRIEKVKAYQAKQVSSPAFPPTNFTGTGDAASAGNLLAPGFLREVQNYIYREDSLFGQARVMNIVTNQIEIPFDETRPWDGTSGVVATWTAEAGKIDQSRPVFGKFELKPKKLAALVPITEEMLSDDAATNIDSYVGRTVGEALSYAIDDAIVNGAGTTAVPQGILNSGALIGSGAGGTTTLTANFSTLLDVVLEMFSRQANPATCSWWTTHDIFPQLQKLVIGERPVWTSPQSGISVTPYGEILGRPLYLHKALADIPSSTGTITGQINCWDMPQYMMATRGGVQSAMSIHLWFDYQTTAFRYTVRVDGKTWATQPIPSPAVSTPVGGTNAITARAHKTTSCFLSSNMVVS